MRKAIKTATQRHVMWRALKVSLIVGTLLNIINHFDVFYGERFDLQTATQIALTYIVPYFVSTHGQILPKHTD
jgi:Mg/Co/Ni transporter MgtE